MNFYDAVEVISGGTPKTNIEEYWNGDIDWLSVVDFASSNKYVYSSEKHITQAGLENSSTKILKKGSIIISARGTVGKMAVLAKDMAFNQSCFGLCAIPSVLNQDYLFYYLTNYMQNILNKTQGSVFKTINLNTFKMIELELPILSEQEKIASVLSNIDNKIELNKSICSDLEMLAKEIYDYWFIQFDFPNENGKPYKSSGGKMVWNEALHREIPQGWEVDKIGNLLGVYPKTKSVLRDDYAKGFCYPIIDQSKKFICGYTDDDSKVLHMRSAIVFGDHTNFVKYVNFNFARGADGTQIINSNTTALDNYLLYLQICSLPIIEQGYTRHYKFLKEQYVLIPTQVINNKYMARVRPYLEKVTLCIKENRDLSRLRDFLLPMLMNGQIKIEA